MSSLITRKCVNPRRVVKPLRFRRVSFMEEFHTYYDILNDVRVVFLENLDDLRSTLSSFYEEIFFT